MARIARLIGLLFGVSLAVVGVEPAVNPKRRNAGMGHGSAHDGMMRPNKGVPQGQPRNCVVADFAVHADFDVQQYVGTWYTIAHAEASLYPFHRRSHYNIEENGQLSMTTHRIAEQEGCERIDQFYADAYVRPDTSAHNSMFLVQPRGIDVPPEDYWVVYTDYTDHALVYSCSELADDGSCAAGRDHVWFLGRHGELSAQARRHMMSFLPGLCVDGSRMINVPKDCDEELGVPELLPESTHGHGGLTRPSCNVNNFQTMQGFDKTQYTGTWYVVAHLQDGAYPYHRVSHYTLQGDGSLTMSTYHISRPGECSTAWRFKGQVYLPESSDVDSKLVLKPVGLPVYGEPYWVAYTDYTDHSLVYLCKEQNDDGSCVEGAAHAWLLSRSGNLTDEARDHMEMLLTEMCVDPDNLVDTPAECDNMLGPETLISEAAPNNCEVERFPTMRNFDKTQYAGKWYVASHLQASTYPYMRVSQYTLGEDGSFTMTTDRINGPDSCSSAARFEGTATRSEYSPSPAKMTLKPSGMDVAGDDYWVVYTDYRDHALVYSCVAKNPDGTCQEGSSKLWLLTRRPAPSMEARRHLVSILSDLCLSPALITAIPTECDEALGVASISRCDVNRFGVMENFDMSQYVGTWYTVARLQPLYPHHRVLQYDLINEERMAISTHFVQGPGECSTARHFESRVVAGDDASGKLLIYQVTDGIPAEGEDYWVVYANYTDHALIYTCNRQNLDGTCAPEATSAFMMSRQPTLSVEARQHMEVLLQGLCVEPSQMVDTPSECDESLLAGLNSPGAEGTCVVDELPVMDNFNINMYAGVWYTVSQIQPFNYPFHRVSNYTMQDNGRILMSTDQFVRPGDCSTVHFEAEAFHLAQDGVQADSVRDGKLFVQPLDSRIPPGDYWVVDTDYTDHALVYSCVGKKPDGTCMPGRSMAWFMSRNPGLTRGAISHLRRRLRQMCVNPDRLKGVKTECDEAIGISETVKSCALEDIAVKQDFVIEKFLGDWYELSHTKDEDHMALPDNEKITIKRSSPGSGGHVSIAMKNIRLDGECQRKDISGSGWLGVTEPAKLVVSFQQDTTNGGSSYGGNQWLLDANFKNYWVLDTDYTNYAITYTCHRIEADGSCDPEAQGLWILGRQGRIGLEFWTTIQVVIERACVDAFAIQPNLRPCAFRSPQNVLEESRPCDDTEFGCCLLTDEAAVDDNYSNCPRVRPPVAGEMIPEALISTVEEDGECQKINCKMFCRFGFQKDENGCEICRCKECVTSDDPDASIDHQDDCP